MSENRVLKECNWLPLEEMRNSTIFVTGGTGLVGFNMLQELAGIAEAYNLRILALVRNVEKAKVQFRSFLDRICLVQGDVTTPVQVDEPIHYLIHGASITSSSMFVQQPVETILTSVLGTKNMLDLAREKQVRAMVYLSSMEVYGSPTEKKLLTVRDVDYLNPLEVRSSYPESKRMCESLCVAYQKEYGVNVMIARLAQTFGPGMQPTDRRAIVQFMQSAVENRDIEIKASGESARMYLYTFDAVTALLTLLLKGEGGQAYNLANKETYCSIRELAQQITQVLGSSSQVKVNTGTEEERRIYPPDSYLYLDTAALEALGWHAEYDLEDSISELQKCMEGYE